MPEAIAFACSSYGLTPLEALTAATANPAFVLGMDDRLGTLEVGKRADVLLLEEAAVRAGAVPARPRPRGRDDRRRGAGRMIVWLNGPFGVGKTSVARALLEAKPDWSLLDPEVRGEELVRQWPGVDDFQDLPEWRKAVVEDAVERAGTGDLVIPMTIWRLEYYREIMDGLKGADGGPPVPAHRQRGDADRAHRARSDRAGSGRLAPGSAGGRDSRRSRTRRSAITSERTAGRRRRSRT